MVNVLELITNVETDGCNKVMFPTLQQLSSKDVTTIWDNVFQRVQRLLLLPKPQAVSIPGLGTFCIQKWQALEDGETITFQRPLFSLSQAVAQIRDFKYPLMQFPDDTEIMVLDPETIRMHTHSQQTVQDCLLETLQYFYHILTNGEDADFTLTDVGTLAIRGQQAEMTFGEDFLQQLNKSEHVAEKLFNKRWVISDKETALLPSHLGCIHLLPQFEIKEVPQLATKPLPEQKLLERKESFLCKLLRLRTITLSALFTDEMDEEEEHSDSPLPQTPGTEGKQAREIPTFPVAASHPEEDLDNLPALIQERKQFSSQLQSFGDVEKWLSNKSSKNELEKRLWKHIKTHRAERRAEELAVTDNDTPASSLPQEDIPPPCIPYPQALITLHDLLRKQKTTLVNVFKKAGMEGRNIKKADFIKIIKQTKISISEKELEDVIVFLAAPNGGKYITMEKLMECQNEWLEMKKKESKEAKGGAQTQPLKATGRSATSPPSAEGRDSGMEPTTPEVKLTPLEATPDHTELGQVHQTDHEMKDTSEACRDRTHEAVKRQEMKKDQGSPIKWAEISHLERSGQLAVEEHCFPVTTSNDMGALVNQYRSKGAVSYLNSSKLCREHDIDLNESALQKGLLHPGDKIIRRGQHLMKIRQPGGYYDIGIADKPGGYYNIGTADKPSPPSASKSSKSAAGKQGKEDFHQMNQKEKGNMMSDNRFWPGHLLDKMRLCIPEEKFNRAHPLFSCVRMTRPVYGIM
uniref:Uncharacterized protein n=1 Tax=Coturnix japonica TaxID=93934 RepID=A0A8C2YDG5_COTJA